MEKLLRLEERDWMSAKEEGQDIERQTSCDLSLSPLTICLLSSHVRYQDDRRVWTVATPYARREAPPLSMVLSLPHVGPIELAFRSRWYLCITRKLGNVFARFLRETQLATELHTSLVSVPLEQSSIKYSKSLNSLNRAFRLLKLLRSGIGRKFV